MSAAFDQPAKLARMAGQIADFFAAYPEDKAVPAIAEHINQFWTPRMRAELARAFPPGTPGLHPLVAQALPLVRLPAA